MRIDDQTTVADYLVLGTWEALTLLGEARELCDVDEVAELLSKAEEIFDFRRVGTAWGIAPVGRPDNTP